MTKIRLVPVQDKDPQRCLHASSRNFQYFAHFIIDAFAKEYTMLCVNPIGSFSSQEAGVAFRPNDLRGCIVPFHSASAQPDIRFPSGEHDDIVTPAIAADRPAFFR
jgi:hypothetical protein